MASTVPNPVENSNFFRLRLNFEPHPIEFNPGSVASALKVAGIGNIWPGFGSTDHGLTWH